MLTLRIAFRTILRRKARMALIGSLVAFGSFLLAFGGIFAHSADRQSRLSIIENFTGDFIVYSARSRELPSPFAFNTPLPILPDRDLVEAALESIEGLDSYAFYAQNYAILEADRDGKKVDLPLIFYAIEPVLFRRVFNNFDVKSGSFFGDVGAEENKEVTPVVEEGSENVVRGVLLSEFQRSQYEKNYGVSLESDEAVKILGLTESGVNAVGSSVVGIFTPRRYASVFNYINLMDAKTYAELFNYTGVEALPDELNELLSGLGSGDEAVFALAGNESFGGLDVSTLVSTSLSGYTMAAVRMKDPSLVDQAIERLISDESLGVKVARWDEASGFYARIAEALKAFIFVATGLIFLVVVMIFMNTLIINVLERTAEIGTMRALGATRGFVRRVLVAETLILNVPASIAGMLAAVLIFAATGKSGLPIPESVSQFLIGGGPLPLVGTLVPFLSAFASVLVVSVLATLYPASVASSITPGDAMADR